MPRTCVSAAAPGLPDEPRLSRRSLLAALPGAALLGAGAAKAASGHDTERRRMIEVIEQLEAWQGWEPSSTVAAKAFAAWQMRKALGLDMPNPETAQMHVDYQRQKFEDYRRTVWFERDQAEGKHYQIAPMEAALA